MNLVKIFLVLVSLVVLTSPPLVLFGKYQDIEAFWHGRGFDWYYYME